MSVKTNSPVGRPLLLAATLAISTAVALGFGASLQAADPVKKSTTKAKSAAKDSAPAKPDTKPLLDVWPIRMVDVPTEGGAKHFMMRIPIKAKRGVLVDPADVVVQVRFYDQVEGEKVVATVAKVEPKWAEAPVDWVDGEMEELNVEYQLNTDGVERKYYGYTVRVLYKGELQTSTAEPKQLLEQFPQ